MKRKIAVMIVLALALTSSIMASPQIFTGKPNDVLQPSASQGGPEEIIATTTPQGINLKCKIWCADDAEGKKLNAEQVKGKPIALHSKILNNKHGDRDDIVAKAVIDSEGWVTFDLANPSVKIGDNQPVRERVWYSIVLTDGASFWGCIPLNSGYMVKDSKGNPGLEFIFTPTEIFAVPPDWAKDNPKKYGIAPDALYGKGYEKKPTQTYKK